jgi:hypothetical protein
MTRDQLEAILRNNQAKTDKENGWVLPEGSYTFSARYRQPERGWQLLLAALALAVTLATLVNYRRRRTSALP